MKKRIVQAAADEFARVGFEGARIERIAEAAECNRSLVYFYFGGKEGLFEAVLDEGAEHREDQMAAQPATLKDGLVYWFRRNWAGLLRSDLDPDHLMTAFLALTSFPAAFPRVAAASLGATDDEDLVDRWSAGLAALATLLAPPDAADRG